MILKKGLVIDGRKRKDLWFASIIQQKHNVGFYFYFNLAAHKQISPALLEHLDDKSCFHIRALTPQLKKYIDAALKAGWPIENHGWL